MAPLVLQETHPYEGALYGAPHETKFWLTNHPSVVWGNLVLPLYGEQFCLRSKMGRLGLNKEN